MALINSYYIFVSSEKITRGVDVTSHPVETGLDITDNVRKNAITLSIEGYIVKNGSTSASTLVNALTKLHQSGKYVKYQGRNTLSKALITDFDTEYTNEVNGGCSFSMEIQEIRVAKSAYKSSSATTTKQVTSSSSSSSKSSTSKTYYTVKSGDCLWSIAKKYYGNGAKYTQIYNANKSTIGSNPNLIYAGQKLLIP